MQKKLVAVVGLIGIGIMGRLVPHIPNATPITAITVSGSRYVGRVWAVIIPLLAMFLSDAVIGFYDWKILLSVYLSFFVIGMVAAVTKKYSISAIWVVVVSSVLFFLITNFSVWLFSPWYDKTISGLLYCYFLGLPFMRNMLLGDLFFSALLLKGPQTLLNKRLALVLNKLSWSASRG